MSDKNDKQFILNPKTNRMIKIGSRVYNKLVTEGVLKINNEIKKDNNILFELEEIKYDENKEEIFKNKKEELKKEYNNNEIVEKDEKLIKRNKKLNRVDFIEQLTSIIYKVLNLEDEIKNYLKSLTIGELKNEINELIIN